MNVKVIIHTVLCGMPAGRQHHGETTAYKTMHAIEKHQRNILELFYWLGPENV